MSMRGSGDDTDVKLDKIIITVTMRTVEFSLQPSCSLNSSRKWCQNQPETKECEVLWLPDGTKGNNKALYGKWMLIHGRFKLKEKQTFDRNLTGAIPQYRRFQPAIEWGKYRTLGV